MPPQQHLYNGVARPADYCIFVPEWTRLPMGKFMLDSQIVCHGHRGWPMASTQEKHVCIKI